MPYYRSIWLGSPTYRINTLPRTIGLELELSNWGRLATDKPFRELTYDPAHDWSVSPSGQEMVISPLSGDQYLRAIHELAEQLYVTGAKVNDSCAYHVHIGGSDLSYWDLRKILQVYESLEGEIYDHLILPHRRDVPEVNHYCQMLTRQHSSCRRCDRFDRQFRGARVPMEPLGNILERMRAVRTTRELKAELFRMLYGMGNLNRKDAGRQLQTRKGGRYEWCRYVGLNLHAWMYRGTVEFRMKEASVDFQDLAAWPLWCGWFIEAATKLPERRTLCDRFGLLQFTEEFMPRWITDWVDKKMREKVKPVMDVAPLRREEGAVRRVGEPPVPSGNITYTRVPDAIINEHRWVRVVRVDPSPYLYPTEPQPDERTEE